MWCTSEINNDGENQKTKNCDDLDTGEDKFCFSIDGYGKDIKAEDNDNNDRDPCGNLEVVRSTLLIR
jgi:hypothetical protein